MNQETKDFVEGLLMKLFKTIPVNRDSLIREVLVEEKSIEVLDELLVALNIYEEGSDGQ